MRHLKIDTVERFDTDAHYRLVPSTATATRRALGDYLFSGTGFSVTVGGIIAGLALAAAFMKTQTATGNTQPSEKPSTTQQQLKEPSLKP